MIKTSCKGCPNFTSHGGRKNFEEVGKCRIHDNKGIMYLSELLRHCPINLEGRHELPHVLKRRKSHE